MLIVISPAKSLDFENQIKTPHKTKPRFLKASSELIQKLKSLSPKDISSLMSLSTKLAELNHSRYQSWKESHTTQNAKPCLFAFQGDVYQGMETESFTEKDLTVAQKNLRILSGLYGLLRPLDIIQPYRLEMGTKLKVSNKKNLYEFWQNEITKQVLKDMSEAKTDILVNLASNEYFKSINTKDLNDKTIISPVFKDYKNGTYKIISFYAKKARGMMSAFLIKNHVSDLKGLKKFNTAGYKYSKELTEKEFEPVFVRKVA